MLRRIAMAILDIRNDITEPQDLERALARFQTGTPAGQHVSIETAQTLPAVEAAVKVIAETTAGLPIRVMRVDGDRREPASDHSVFDLMLRPNDWQTPFEFREMMTRDVLYRGNAYARKVSSGGRVIELLRLHPDQVKVEVDDRLEVTYRYRREDGRHIDLRRSEVFHLRGPSDDGFTGLSPIAQHRNSIGEALALQDHSARWFGNGAKPSGLLEQDDGTDMGPETRKALKEDFEEFNSGKNAYSTAVLPAGVKFKPVAISHEDAQFIESRQFSVLEVCRIFRVPPHKLAHLADATFSNIEHQGLEFIRDTIAPWCSRWEQALERDLIDRNETVQIRHNMNGLMRGDSKARAEYYQIMRRNGAMTANEIRRFEDMNPREDDAGDQFIIEGNMMPDDGRRPDEPN